MSWEKKDENEKGRDGGRYGKKRKDKGEEDKETVLVTSVPEEGGEIRTVVERSNKVSILFHYYFQRTAMAKSP